MSLTIAAVPLMTLHSSRPFVPSFATKTSFEPKAVSSCGEEYAPPGAMSAVMKVWPGPALPSLCQSSSPCAPSFALKNTAPLATVRS